MEIKVLTSTYRTAILTNEHAVCNYKQPVLLVGGQAYGIADRIAGDLPTVVIWVPPANQRVQKTGEEMSARLDMVNAWNAAVQRHGQ
jgi:hypothetical protein